MEISSAPAAVAQKSAPSGFLRELAWFFSGAVLPLGSLSFYREAARRKVGLAILFFFTFTILITILITISIGVAMAGFVSEIRQAYQRGTVPAITIRGGVAQVDGPQPAIFLNDRTSQGAILVAADTTGRLTGIDQSRYNQGLLLTRTELHILNANQGYQRVPLSDLNTMFNQDPLVINEQTVSTAWVTFSAVVTVFVFIGLVLWNSVVRLMIIAMLALILWGIVSLFRPNVGYGPFIITGIYAIVPAIYISHLFSRSGVTFPGVQTVLLLIFWALALFGALSNEKFFHVDRVSRLWTALLGVPMLIWLIVDMYAKLPTPAGEIALWAVVALTVAVLIGVRLYFHLTEIQPPAQPAPPQAPVPPQPSA
jgi:uncharacterized protein DUF1189